MKRFSRSPCPSSVHIYGEIYGERILEDIARCFKADAMTQPVAGSFGVVPFEGVILHTILLSSILPTGR
jgi:hypothetical protein